MSIPQQCSAFKWACFVFFFVLVLGCLLNYRMGHNFSNKNEPQVPLTTDVPPCINFRYQHYIMIKISSMLGLEWLRLLILPVLLRGDKTAHGLLNKSSVEELGGEMGRKV